MLTPAATRTAARTNHQAAIEQAISADYGHRSLHETRLAEIAPAVDGIKYALREMGGWMRPQRRHIDRLA